MDMDYLKFLEELDFYNEWTSQEDELAFKDLGTDVIFNSSQEAKDGYGYYAKYPLQGALGLGFYQAATDQKAKNDCDTEGVDHPSHYTRGSQEVIDTIEDAVSDAPNPVLGGLQWNVLKYVMRLWLKDNPKKDALKARWYLNRLISKL